MYPASGILRVLVAASAIAAAGCSRGDGSRADDTRAETTITLGASENPAATASTTPDQKAAEQALDDTLRETEFDDPLTAHCVTARAGAVKSHSVVYEASVCDCHLVNLALI